MIDEFSARIEAQLKEHEEHPERFEVVKVCFNCGSRTKIKCTKEDVARHVEKHGSNESEWLFCDQCCPDKEENEDED